MSKNGKLASDVARDEPLTDSVFDFLYHDARRIGSFISQLDKSGLLTSMKETENAEKSAGTTVGGTVAGSVAVAKAGASLQEATSQVAKEAIERTYDPFWINAIALVDMLDERGLISDGLSNARIGQIVRVSGEITMTDMSTWKGLWAEPSLREAITSSMDGSAGLPVVKGKAAYEAKRAAKDQAGNAKAVLGVLNILPHFVQTMIVDDERNAVWASTPEHNMVGSTGELIFKYGSTIPGRWTVVGVLDAYPDEQDSGGPIAARAPNAFVTGIAEHLITPIRALLGRPADAYGMTPLVIFRELSSS